MSFTCKNLEIFPRLLGFYKLSNIIFQGACSKTSQFLIFSPKSHSVQLVLLSQLLYCILSVKFLISNNSLWWILYLEKCYYPYFYTPIIPNFSLLFPYFFVEGHLKACTVNPVLSGHSKIDKTKILKTNGICCPSCILKKYCPDCKE